jgi:hypothetical protein
LLNVTVAVPIEIFVVLQSALPCACPCDCLQGKTFEKKPTESVDLTFPQWRAKAAEAEKNVSANPKLYYLTMSSYGKSQVTAPERCALVALVVRTWTFVCSALCWAVEQWVLTPVQILV